MYLYCHTLCFRISSGGSGFHVCVLQYSCFAETCVCRDYKASHCAQLVGIRQYVIQCTHCSLPHRPHKGCAFDVIEELACPNAGGVGRYFLSQDLEDQRLAPHLGLGIQHLCACQAHTWTSCTSSILMQQAIFWGRVNACAQLLAVYGQYKCITTSILASAGSFVCTHARILAYMSVTLAAL